MAGYGTRVVNTFRTHYDNLQVKEDASSEVIRGAYRYLSQRWHPDKNPQDLQEANRIILIINEAYNVLSDGQRRRVYDDRLAIQRTTQTQQTASKEGVPSAGAPWYDAMMNARRMAACIWCGNEIYMAAPLCPHCGGAQHPAPASTTSSYRDSGLIWLPIACLVVGVVCMLALFDDSKWDTDAVVGIGTLSVLGLALGTISLSRQRTGKGMAITGLVLSAMTLMATIRM